MSNPRIPVEPWVSAHYSLSCWLDSHSTSLPMMPGVAAQVLEITADENSSQQQLAELIQSDQALASWVMRVANSAAYNVGATVVSLQQAITRLGMDMVTDIAISATTQMQLFKGEQYQGVLDRLAVEALAQGLWAKEVARHIRGNVESAFLAGLLQSIGKPLVLLALADISEDQNIELDDVKIRKFLSDFECEYGLAISEQWELPEVIQTCIEFARSPHTATSHTIMVKVVDAAQHFMHTSLYPELYSVEELLQQHSISALNLYQNEVQDLLDKAEAIKEKTLALKVS